MATKQPPCRKRTNAEIKKNRMRREREQKLNAKRLQWRDLAQIHVNHMHLLTNAETAVAQMLASEFVTAAMDEDKKASFAQRKTELDSAIAIHRQSLTDIGEKHMLQKGAAISLMDNFAAIQIGEEYEKWYGVVMDDVITRSQTMLMDIEDIIVAKYPTVAAARDAMVDTTPEIKETQNDTAD